MPLVFVLMSGKKKRDYRGVFKKLLELLPSPAVKQVTLDFVEGTWPAATRRQITGVPVPLDPSPVEEGQFQNSSSLNYLTRLSF